MNQSNSNKLRSATVWLLLPCITGFLAGCACSNPCTTRKCSQQPARANPLPTMVFQIPTWVGNPPRPLHGLAAQEFYRDEWPVSNLPEGYVSGSESAAYYESTYDRLENYGHGKPRDRFYQERRSVRTITKYR